MFKRQQVSSSLPYFILLQQGDLQWFEPSADMLTFGNIAVSTTLGTGSRIFDKAGRNIPLVKMGNLNWGTWSLSEVEFVSASAKGAEQLVDGDFLFNTRNTPELVGKSAVWHRELPVATFDNNLLRARFSERGVADYICAYMTAGRGCERVHSLADATTSVAAIYWRQLQSFLLPLPKRNEQLMAVDFMMQAAAAIDETASVVSKLRRLKAGLMHDLLTGRVPVTPLLANPKAPI